MANSPPARPNLTYLKKLAKDRLRLLRERQGQATLAEAQLLVAREQGFSSWRALHASVGLAEAVAALPALESAISSADLPAMRRLLRAHPGLVDARTAEGATVLHLAVQMDREDLIDLLVDAGASLTSTYGENGHVPLSWASTYGSPRAAAALLRRGAPADLFCAAGLGLLPQVQAAFDGQGALKPGASSTGSSRYDASGKPLPRPPLEPADIIADALCLACRHGHEEVVRWLLARGPNLAFKAFLGATPLHWAEFSGNDRICALLLQAGANPNARDHDGRTPRAFGICVPASFGRIARVRGRSARDPTLASNHDGCNTPLHEAAAIGHVTMIKMLLAHGADRTAVDIRGRTPQQMAEERGKSEAAIALASPSD